MSLSKKFKMKRRLNHLLSRHLGHVVLGLLLNAQTQSMLSMKHLVGFDRDAYEARVRAVDEEFKRVKSLEKTIKRLRGVR